MSKKLHLEWSGKKANMGLTQQFLTKEKLGKGDLSPMIIPSNALQKGFTRGDPGDSSEKFLEQNIF